MTTQKSVNALRQSVDLYGFEHGENTFVTLAGFDNRLRRMFEADGYVKSMEMTVGQARKAGIGVPFGHTVNSVLYSVNRDKVYE